MHPKRKGRNAVILVSLIVLFPLTWLLLFGVFSKHSFNTLPYYTPSCLKGCKDSSYRIPPFTFQDERGLPFSNDSLNSNVWLAAFYDLGHSNLTDITQLLLNVNFKYRNEPDIRIVVFSTDPARDSLEKIARYIESNTRYNAFPQKWKYLIGDSASMRAYLKNGFLLNDPDQEAIFRLVDYDGKIRGQYGNTEYHFLGGLDSIPGVVQDIALLKKEIDQKRYEKRHRDSH
jgi:cytochrome oxidase Cu insertion factor (SCO1/SenC/PrrC family)